MNDRPIDKVRNSALSLTLPPDTGSISDMGEINGALHMIGGSAIYRLQLADEIDPERTNIAIPNTHQKVLSYGTEFPYVRQTLMTARRLFSNNVLGSAFDYKTGINVSFEALHDLAAMHDIRKDVRARFDKIAEDLKNLTVERRSMTVPSMGDVRGETKAFLQKADHVAVALFNIAKLFYGDEIGPRWFASLHKLASDKYGDNDGFTKFLKAALPFLQFVRNARNAVEHPDQAKSVKVTDISLLPSGELNPPKMAGVVAAQLARGQTNFLGSLFGLERVFRPEYLLADHAKPFDYQIPLPAEPTRRRASLYVHTPRGRKGRSIDVATERFVDETRMSATS